MPKATADELRKMTPHEKCNYWNTRIDLLAHISGKGDNRFCRHAMSFLETYETTSDATLKSLMATLEAKVGLAAKCDCLSPDRVVDLQEKEYVAYTATMNDLEFKYPVEVQLGFLRRKVANFVKQSWFSLAFVKMMLPFCDAEDGYSELFRTDEPTVVGLTCGDDEKAKFFLNFLGYDFIQKNLEKGPDSYGSAAALFSEAIEIIQKFSADAELSAPVIEAVSDALTGLRALVVLLDHSLSTQILNTNLKSQRSSNFRLQAVGRRFVDCVRHDCFLCDEERSLVLALGGVQEVRLEFGEERWRLEGSVQTFR